MLKTIYAPRAASRIASSLANPDATAAFVANLARRDDTALIMVPPNQELSPVRPGDLAISVEVEDVVVDLSCTLSHVGELLKMGLHDVLYEVGFEGFSRQAVVDRLFALCIDAGGPSDADYEDIVTTGLLLIAGSEQGQRLLKGTANWASVTVRRRPDHQYEADIVCGMAACCPTTSDIVH